MFYVKFEGGAFGQNLLLDTSATYSLMSTQNKNLLDPRAVVKTLQGFNETKNVVPFCRNILY